MSAMVFKMLNRCFSSKLIHCATPSSPPPSVSIQDQNPSPPSILINNFNLLYDHLSSPHSPSKPPVPAALSDDPHSTRLAAVFGSPGSFQPDCSSLDPMKRLIGGGVAFARPVDSPDPYADFRASMQEMVEAQRGMSTSKRDTPTDREFLHELLFCYLSLNPKHTHRFIMSAFADTLLSLSSPVTAAEEDRRTSALKKPREVNYCTFS